MQSDLKRLAIDNADLAGRAAIIQANRFAPRYDPARIIRTVCDYFHVTEAELFSDRKFRSLTYPRIAATALLRKQGMTLYGIAETFGRDHTTVMYFWKESLRRAGEDDVFARQMDELEKIVRNGFCC
jgi:chromosomal replication initiation ATPase DnaA